MAENKENRKRYNQQRSKIFVAVLHVPFNRTDKFIDLGILNSSFKNYACILHDMDSVNNLDFNINQDYSLPVSLKPLHYHLVLELAERSYCSAVNSLLSKLFDFPSNCVSVEKCINLNLSLRYLIHLDDKDKYQYPFENIRTSNYVWLLTNFNQSEQAVQQFVYKALVNCKGDYDLLLNTIGFKLAKTYYQIINQYFRVYYKSH